jgi:hypothetical protein
LLRTAEGESRPFKRRRNRTSRAKRSEYDRVWARLQRGFVTERVMLDDGTVLGLPHFLLSQTSELIKVGTILKAKYAYRNGGKAVAFIEVSQNWPDPGGCFRSSLIRAPVSHE